MLATTNRDHSTTDDELHDDTTEAHCTSTPHTQHEHAEHEHTENRGGSRHYTGTKCSVDRSCTQTCPVHAPASQDSAQHEHTQHEHTAHRRTAQGPHSARAHTSGPRKSRRCACIQAHFLPGCLIPCCLPACARARALLSHALKLHLSGTRRARLQVPAAAASSPRGGRERLWDAPLLRPLYN